MTKCTLWLGQTELVGWQCPSTHDTKHMNHSVTAPASVCRRYAAKSLQFISEIANEAVIEIERQIPVGRQPLAKLPVEIGEDILAGCFCNRAVLRDQRLFRRIIPHNLGIGFGSTAHE